MAAYYNEFDPVAAEWLRELIAEGLIPNGEVDERSIEDVLPNDLFFAGIGGWAFACRIAGISDDFPIWTGSCPCQPFSAAGKRAGFADERHLWPAFHWLVEQRRPEILVGEQVAESVRQGWLDLVFADLEGTSYACGAVVAGAHSVGAPHIRQRVYWVANSHRDGHQRPRNVRTARRDEFADGGAVDWTRWIGVPCRDGKWRPIPESAFQLVHDGLSADLGNLRPEGGYPLCGKIEGRAALIKGAGNAIVPQLAAEFLKAALP